MERSRLFGKPGIAAEPFTRLAIRAIAALKNSNCSIIFVELMRGDWVMTKSDFEGLAEKEQLDRLQSDGVYVGKRKIEGRTAVLFQLHDFYVEVLFSKYRTDVHHLKIASSTDLLQPYLDQVE